MTSKTEHITSFDVMQRFLVWINSQPSEHSVQQARSVHIHLHTHGIGILGFPHSDLHAQWSQLESMELTHSMENVIHQFLETPPTPKQDTIHTEIKEPTTPSAPPHTAPSTTSIDPAKYPISILVGWSAYDDPPQTPITACILGTAWRPIFGKHLCSIRDDVVKAPKSFTFLGVAEDGKILSEIPGAVNVSEWRVNWKKGNRQPWAPWVPGITYKTPTPAKETQEESTGRKHKHHKRSRSRSISSANNDSSVEKDKHKWSRERREKMKHKESQSGSRPRSRRKHKTSKQSPDVTPQDSHSAPPTQYTPRSESPPTQPTQTYQTPRHASQAWQNDLDGPGWRGDSQWNW